MNNNIHILKTKTILFVDDDESILEKTKATLSIIFKNVLLANSAKLALEIYGEERPDIIFSDIKMPVMDGLEFAKKIRRQDQVTPIVLFTAHSDQKYLFKAVNLSIDGYLTKPANLNDMLDVFCRCIRRNKQEDKYLVDFGNNIVYSTSARELYDNGNKIALGLKEEPLLKLLIKNYPDVTTKEQISTEIWPLDTISDSYIKNVIARLRAKIGAEQIVSVTGIGWRLVLADTAL